MWGLREERWSGEWNSSFWWWKSQSLKLLMNKTLNSERFHLAHWICWRLGSREGQELKLFQRREIIYQMYIFLTASKLIVIYSKQSHYYYLKIVGKNIQITIMIYLLSQNLFHVQSWISSSFKFLPLFRIWPLASTITMTVPVSLTTWRFLVFVQSFEKHHTLLKGSKSYNLWPDPVRRLLLLPLHELPPQLWLWGDILFVLQTKGTFFLDDIQLSLLQVDVTEYAIYINVGHENVEMCVIWCNILFLLNVSAFYL